MGGESGTERWSCAVERSLLFRCEMFSRLKIEDLLEVWSVNSWSSSSNSESSLEFSSVFSALLLKNFASESQKKEALKKLAQLKKKLRQRIVAVIFLRERFIKKT